MRNEQCNVNKLRRYNHGGHGVSRRKRQKSNQNSVFSVYSVVKFLLLDIDEQGEK
jgi:hypothetical protein